MSAIKDESDAAQTGHFLDRLLMLEKIFPSDDILQILRDTGHIDTRRCTLSFEVTFWVVLAMGIFTHLPIRAVVKASTSLHRLTKTPVRSALCMARQRLGVAPLLLLFRRVVRPLAKSDTPGCWYKGMRLMAVDGVVMTVPDSPANAQAFGRASAGPRGDAAFPQIRKLSLVETGTHAEIAFAVKGIGRKAGEQAMLPALLKHFAAGMLVLFDRGFYGYQLWRKVVVTGADALMRLSCVVNLPVLKSLADDSYLSKVYPDASARRKDRGGVLVRVIRYTHNDPRRVDCGKEHRLLTTLLDAEKYPARDLIILYHERWEIELTFDEQKTHHAPIVPGKEAQLRSETPRGVIQELYALSLGHYVTRAFMVEAASVESLDPDRLSFVGCLRVLQNRMPEYPAVKEEDKGRWYQALLKEIAGERLPPRRNRSNPRVVKVKMSKFLKKRAIHRGVRPLTQTFANSIVMLR